MKIVENKTHTRDPKYEALMKIVGKITPEIRNMRHLSLILLLSLSLPLLLLLSCHCHCRCHCYYYCYCGLHCHCYCYRHVTVMVIVAVFVTITFIGVISEIGYLGAMDQRVFYPMCPCATAPHSFFLALFFRAMHFDLSQQGLAPLRFQCGFHIAFNGVPHPYWQSGCWQELHCLYKCPLLRRSKSDAVFHTLQAAHWMCPSSFCSLQPLQVLRYVLLLPLSKSVRRLISPHAVHFCVVSQSRHLTWYLFHLSLAK